MRLFLLIVLVLPVLRAADPPPATAAGAVAKPAWAAAMGKDQYGTWADLAVAGMTQRMRLIPAGSFTMGCSMDESEQATACVRQTQGADIKYFVAPQHQVTFALPFWLADSTCTQAAWLAVMGTEPSLFFTDDPQLPVENVSWDDSQAFVTELNLALGLDVVQLPAEDEWEYACRAGTMGWFHAANLDDIAWYNVNSGGRPHPVKLKAPNAWGVHDMQGNVMQWCDSWYGLYPDNLESDGPWDQPRSRRCIRGGFFRGMPAMCRSAMRVSHEPEMKGSILGFRIAIPPQPGASP